MDPTVTYAMLVTLSLLVVSLSSTMRMLMRMPLYWVGVVISIAIVYSLFSYFDAIPLLNVLTGVGIISNAFVVRFLLKMERHHENHVRNSLG